MCSHANGSQQSCQVKDDLLKGHEESCRMGIRAFMTRADAERGPRLRRLSNLEAAAAVASTAAPAPATKTRAAGGPVLLGFGLVHGQRAPI